MPSLTRPVVKLTVSCRAPPTLGGAWPMYEAEGLSKRRHSSGVTESSTRSLNAVVFLAFLMMVQLRGFAVRAHRSPPGCREGRRGNTPVIQTTCHAGRSDRPTGRQGRSRGPASIQGDPAPPAVRLLHDLPFPA